MGQVSNFRKCTLWVMKPFERFPLEIFFYEKSPLWEVNTHEWWPLTLYGSCPLVGGGVHSWEVHLMGAVAFWEVSPYPCSVMILRSPLWELNTHGWCSLMGVVSLCGEECLSTLGIFSGRCSLLRGFLLYMIHYRRSPLWEGNTHAWYPLIGGVPLWGRCPLLGSAPYEKCSLLRGFPLYNVMYNLGVVILQTYS